MTSCYLQPSTKTPFPWVHHSRTLSCSSELEVWAVGCVASGGASAHMEDVDGGGSEACHHHTGILGSCWWVAQLFLFLGKKKEFARGDTKAHCGKRGGNDMFHKQTTSFCANRGWRHTHYESSAVGLLFACNAHCSVFCIASVHNNCLFEENSI